MTFQVKAGREAEQVGRSIVLPGCGLHIRGQGITLWTGIVMDSRNVVGQAVFCSTEAPFLSHLETVRIV